MSQIFYVAHYFDKNNNRDLFPHIPMAPLNYGILIQWNALLKLTF